MIECVFTIDYEIYGNGDGSLKELIFEPASKMIEIFKKYDSRFVAFIELAELEMIDLNKIKYKWLHANYNLFKHPGPNSKIYYPGTEEMKQIIGRSKIDMLCDIASSMKLNPTEPDLFAYKKKENHAAKYDMIFIEVKRKDQVSDKQYLGINLIEKYLKIPCRIVRYKKL